LLVSGQYQLKNHEQFFTLNNTMKPSVESLAPRRDNRSTWLVVASIMAAGLVTADAQLLSADDFLYAPGDLTGPSPDGQPAFFAGNWDPNAAWGGVPGTILQVQGTSASYPGLENFGGSLAVGSQTFSDGWAGANSVANRASRQFTTPWTSASSGTYFISFLMGFGQDTIDSVGYRAFEMWSQSVNDSPGRVLQLGYSSYGDFGGGGAGLTGMNLHVTPNGANTPGEPLALDTIVPLTGSASFAADGGATHFFVLRFDLSAIAGQDVIQVYLDPSDLGSEAGNSPNAVFVGDFAASHLSAGSMFILPALADGAAGGPHDVSPLPANIGIFDRLRVAGDWISAVPEPTSFSLLGLGVLGMAMVARRQRR
jgi:hypothetical protein